MRRVHVEAVSSGVEGDVAEDLGLVGAVDDVAEELRVHDGIVGERRRGIDARQVKGERIAAQDVELTHFLQLHARHK